MLPPSMKMDIPVARCLPLAIDALAAPWGWKAAEGKTDPHDLHATILHLLGVDHTRLTFRHNGLDRRLTDVHGHVVREVLS
mgnify:CR=1 FL=1